MPLLPCFRSFLIFLLLTEVAMSKGRVALTTNMVIGGTVKDDSGDEWLNLDQKVILLISNMSYWWLWFQCKMTCNSFTGNSCLMKSALYQNLSRKCPRKHFVCQCWISRFAPASWFNETVYFGKPYQVITHYIIWNSIFEIAYSENSHARGAFSTCVYHFNEYPMAIQTNALLWSLSFSTNFCKEPWKTQKFESYFRHP